MAHSGSHEPAASTQAEAPATHEAHKAAAPGRVACVVVTTSDTRTPETDEGGRLLVRLLTEAGHEVVGYHLVRDDESAIQAVFRSALDDRRVQAILFTGGTGVGRRDCTYEVVEDYLRRRFRSRRLDGFGELFRMLSYQEIGSSAMLSRAVAGVVDGKLVFSLPGSPAAVRLAMTKLILPELGHLIREIER
ncbi:MAG TPA: MogA/MoaB family molybdenum cofactor biosynthesis protein [Thermodesulfobacteriota bacterium]